MCRCGRNVTRAPANTCSSAASTRWNLATFTISDFAHAYAYGRQLLYDIVNDSYDVTERKTGSLICRLAMADTFPLWHVFLFIFVSGGSLSGLGL